MCHSRWMKIRWCGMCGVMGSRGVVGITCGCGRNLMLAAFKVAHMSCTQRQRGGAAERGEWAEILCSTVWCCSDDDMWGRVHTAVTVLHGGLLHRILTRGEVQVGWCGAVGWRGVVEIAR